MFPMARQPENAETTMKTRWLLLPDRTVAPGNPMICDAVPGADLWFAVPRSS
jgi:hypothetical protein